MRLYLPRNIDLAALIYENPPPFKPFKRDKLRYIIHLIITISQYKKDLLSEEFVPIHSQTLQKKIQNYKEYLDYLIDDLKIVECNNHYIVGFKSKGYRLVEKYRKSSLESIQVEDLVLRKALRRQKTSIDSTVLNHNYITKWFDKNKVKIDLPFVKHFLDEELKLKLANMHLWDVDRSSKKKKNPWNQYNHAIVSAENLDRGDYHLLLDNNVFRLHTNLTNMRSIVRNALTYDGQKLISVDIKNSQPYLSTVLFREGFWLGEYYQDKTRLNKTFSRTQNDPFININGLITINNIKVTEIDSYIMLGENALDLENKDFGKYIDLVVNGQLYDFLEKEFGKNLGVRYCNRQEVKAAVFQVLFTDNRFIGQKEAAPKKMFQGLFADVYDVFAKIKRQDSTLLPRLLQSIESYLIIDVIAKRISLEYPDAPIFTIHDSITTTEEYVESVTKIMQEELVRAIGYAPVLQTERWDKIKIVDYLVKLENKSRAVA
jgi:hypothetical protein|tara:strand:+ start:29202 stop:30665 length:1464 start_codon:yes stop_codon:yes gene_type:complete